jgi:hypothetical protein
MHSDVPNGLSVPVNHQHRDCSVYALIVSPNRAAFSAQLRPPRLAASYVTVRTEGPKFCPCSCAFSYSRAGQLEILDCVRFVFSQYPPVNIGLVFHVT